LTKAWFEPDFFAFRSVLFLQQTSLLQTISELDKYINIEWIYKECKAWFQLLEMVRAGLELLQ